MRKSQYLPPNIGMIKDKVVLDLACHDGESTSIIHKLGAKHIYGVDVRKELIDCAAQQIQTNNVEFFERDITDYNFISTLVSKSNAITCFGVFYHLFDHFRFLTQILKPNIEHVLIETEFGTESIHPKMDWVFEATNHKLHGYSGDLKIIPVGIPNLSWILYSAEILGFKCDWIQYFGGTVKLLPHQISRDDYAAIAGPDWPSYIDIISNNSVPQFVKDEISNSLSTFTGKRMVLRLYNTNVVQSTPLVLEEIYKWPY